MRLLLLLPVCAPCGVRQCARASETKLKGRNTGR